ncbi:MAG: CvpA family protein [Clostridia bacterium]|nr:CvpA family protein [Clostridia bacterium]
MGIVIDILLLAIAVIFIIRHARLGFVKSVLNSLKALLAIGLAFLLRVPVARLFDSWFMNKAVTQWVYESLSSSAIGADPAFDLVTLYETCPMAYNGLLSSFGLETEGLDGQITNIESLSDEAIVALSENIGSSLSYFCSIALALLVLFVIAIIALTIVIAVLDLVTRLPVLNFLNRVLGGVIGVVWAALFAWALGTVLTVVSTFLPDLIGQNAITDSIILGLLADIQALNIIPGLFQ